MTVTINSTDQCVQGFERLRKRTEFILSTPVTSGMTRKDVLDALKADMQACDRPTNFDWEGCRAALDEILGNPDRLSEVYDPDIEDGDPDHDAHIYLFIYCEQATENP